MMGRVTGPIPNAMFIAGVTYSIADLYAMHKHNPGAASALAASQLTSASGPTCMNPVHR
jgi:hypothetical protein